MPTDKCIKDCLFINTINTSLFVPIPNSTRAQITGIESKHAWMKRVEATLFFTSNHLDAVAIDIETVYTKYLTQGHDRRQAMRKLRVVRDRFEPLNYDAVRLGFTLGICFIRWVW